MKTIDSTTKIPIHKLPSQVRYFKNRWHDLITSYANFQKETARLCMGRQVGERLNPSTTSMQICKDANAAANAWMEAVAVGFERAIPPYVLWPHTLLGILPVSDDAGHHQFTRFCWDGRYPSLLTLVGYMYGGWNEFSNEQMEHGTHVLLGAILASNSITKWGRETYVYIEDIPGNLLPFIFDPKPLCVKPREPKAMGKKLRNEQSRRRAMGLIGLKIHCRGQKGLEIAEDFIYSRKRQGVEANAECEDEDAITKFWNAIRYCLDDQRPPAYDSIPRLALNSLNDTDLLSLSFEKQTENPATLVTKRMESEAVRLVAPHFGVSTQTLTQRVKRFLKKTREEFVLTDGLITKK